jgi:DNA-binding HxlR family transcriptional regulator
MLQAPTIRILLFLYERGEVRYHDLTKLLTSRGTLSVNLKELEDEGLIQRKIVDSKPIQSYYSLTDRGREIAKLFNAIKNGLA